MRPQFSIYGSVVDNVKKNRVDKLQTIAVAEYIAVTLNSLHSVSPPPPHTVNFTSNCSSRVYSSSINVELTAQCVTLE